MTSTRLFTLTTVATATLAAALMVAPSLRHRTALLLPIKTTQPVRHHLPDDGMQQDAAIPRPAPQPGAPQGITQAPPAIPDYQQARRTRRRLHLDPRLLGMDR